MTTAPSYNLNYLRHMLWHGFFSYPHALTSTLFQGIEQIPLGYHLNKSNGKTTIQRQWQLDEQQSPPKDLAATRTEFQQLLQNSICECNDENIAIELSGGLDSSSVAALVRQCYPQQTLHALSNAAPSQIPNWFNQIDEIADLQTANAYLFDESHFSKQVSEHLHLQQHFINDGYDFHQALEKQSETLGAMPEILFPLLNHRVYETAKQLNIKHLFSGFGGDEVISRQGTILISELKQQRAYLKYAYERCCYQLRRKTTRRNSPSLWHVANSHWQYLKPEGKPKTFSFPNLSSQKALEAEFIQGSLSIHWQRRIVNSSIIAQAYDLNYHFPFTNVSLMQFFHNLPTHYKFRHGRTRYLLRQAIKALLPKKIVMRNCKAGATAPSAWCAYVQQFKPFFLDRIDISGNSVIADIVDIDKLKKRIEKSPPIDSNLLRLSTNVLALQHVEMRLRTGFYRQTLR